MFKETRAFSGFSVNSLQAAKDFYGNILGIATHEDKFGLYLDIEGGIPVFIYEKDNHQPASFTVLNFPVKDIEFSHEGLVAKGVVFEHYDDMTDEKGIAWGAREGYGVNIAWFKDPAGNILAILSENP